MSLKEYPKQSKRNAFYSWYLKSTLAGQGLFQKMADKLVLETNINKETAFYRLFKKVKGKKKIVTPKMKRMTLMLCLYAKLFTFRQQQEFFEKFKIYAAKERMQGDIAKRIVDTSRDRLRNTMIEWGRLSKAKKEQ